jgi:RimJ/RimL family protein N-acetyltransferase
VLIGEQVELRHWRPSDAQEVFRICQDPEIQRWTEVPVPYEPADATGFVGSGDDALFAVIDRASGALAGSIGVLRFYAGVASVGYWTAPEMRGAGRTAEALRLLTEWCVAARGCARVELVADVRNAGSRGVARAAGFVEEGVLRGRMLHRGRRIDVVMCSRLPSDPPP